MQLPRHIPFVQALGFELLRFEDGEAEFTLQPREDQLNAYGVAHGGLLMTLLDSAMAHAARSSNLHLPDGGPGVLTVEMKTSFLRPGEGPLRAVGRLLHRTATMAFCEGRVLVGAADTLAAHATGTYKFARAVATGARRVQGDQAAATPSPLAGPGSD